MDTADQIEKLWPKLRDRQILAVDMGQFYKASRLNCILSDYLIRWLHIYLEANSNESRDQIIDSQTNANIVELVNSMTKLLESNALLYYAYDQVYKFVQDEMTTSNLDHWPVHQLKIIHNKCLYLLRKSRYTFKECLTNGIGSGTSARSSYMENVPVANWPTFLASLFGPFVNIANTSIGRIAAAPFLKVARGISLANIYRCLMEVSLYAGHKNLSNILYRIMIDTIHFKSIKYRLRMFTSIACHLERLRHKDEDDNDDGDDDDDDGNNIEHIRQNDRNQMDNQRGQPQPLRGNKKQSLITNENIPERLRLKRRKKHLLEHIDKSCFKFSCRLCSDYLNFTATMSDRCSNCNQPLYFCSFTFEPINMVDISFEGLNIDLLKLKEILQQNTRRHLKILIETLPEQNVAGVEGQANPSGTIDCRSIDSTEENDSGSLTTKRTITEKTINSKSGRVVERMTFDINPEEPYRYSEDKSDENEEHDGRLRGRNYRDVEGEEEDDGHYLHSIKDTEQDLNDEKMQEIPLDIVDQIIKQFYSRATNSKLIRDESDLTESFKLLSYYIIKTSRCNSNEEDMNLNSNSSLRSLMRSPMKVDKENGRMLKLINLHDVIIMESPQSCRRPSVERSHDGGTRIFLKTNNFVSVCWCYMGCQSIFDRRIVEILDSDSRLSNSSEKQVISGLVLPCPICKCDLTIL